MLRIIAHIYGLVYVVAASPKIALWTSRVTTVVNRHPIAGNIFWILMCLLEWSQSVLSSNVVCTVSPVNIPNESMIIRSARASPVTTVVAPIYDDGYITPVATEGFNN